MVYNVRSGEKEEYATLKSINKILISSKIMQNRATLVQLCEIRQTKQKQTNLSPFGPYIQHQEDHSQ